MPRLTNLQAEQLFQKWRETKDPRIQDRLIRHHDALVQKIAYSFVRKFEDRLDVDDLFQEGRLGILKAFDKYDPSISKFATYAAIWIKSYILTYVRNNNTLLKVQMRSKARELDLHFSATLEACLRKDPTLTGHNLHQAIADYEGCTLADVELCVARRTPIFSLDAPKPTSEGTQQLHEFIYDPETVNQENLLIYAMDYGGFPAYLANHLGFTNEREREVLNKRILSDDPATLQYFAAKFGVSRQWINEMEQRLINKIGKQYRARQMVS